jgi:hypothetical protein
MKPMALTRRLPDLPPLRQAPPEVYPYAATILFSMSGGIASAISDNPERCRTDRKAPCFPVPNQKTDLYGMPSDSSPASSGIQTP